MINKMLGFFPAPDALLLLATTNGEIDILEQAVLNGTPNADGSRPECLTQKVQRLCGLDEPGIVVCAACASSSAAVAEGAAMIRTKGEAGSGNIVEAVRHLRQVIGDMRALTALRPEELPTRAKELQAPIELVRRVAETGRLPVPNFAAGGIATPADAALCRQLGAEAVFVGAGAGMGVDSGLPDFRGNEGFWKAYPPFAERGLSFIDMASPDWFDADPALAWGFYGHHLNVVPHAFADANGDAYADQHANGYTDSYAVAHADGDKHP